MQTKRLILLLFALFALPLVAMATPEKDQLRACESAESLQKKDIGMCDLLPATGCGTLAAPSFARPVHDTPIGTSHTVSLAGHAIRGCVLPLVVAAGRYCPRGGGIYMTHCLRL